MSTNITNESRKLAIANNQKHYESTVPCRRGHTGLRYVSNRKCVECMNADVVDISTPRGIARSLGLPRFTPDRPCRKGHLCDRYVSNNRCVECDNASCRSNHASYNDRYERTRKHNLKVMYGLTPTQFDEMKSSQHNQCAICKQEFKSRRHTHVDHNHSTGAVRELLCTQCNMGIGYLKENINTLQAAIEYLVKHQQI